LAEGGKLLATGTWPRGGGAGVGARRRSPGIANRPHVCRGNRIGDPTLGRGRRQRAPARAAAQGKARLSPDRVRVWLCVWLPPRPQCQQHRRLAGRGWGRSEAGGSDARALVLRPRWPRASGGRCDVGRKRKRETLSRRLSRPHGLRRRMRSDDAAGLSPGRAEVRSAQARSGSLARIIHHGCFTDQHPENRLPQAHGRVAG